MHALLTLAIYVTPFLLIAIAAKRWMTRSGVSLSEARAEGGGRRQARFLLGIWRHENPD